MVQVMRWRSLTHYRWVYIPIAAVFAYAIAGHVLLSLKLMSDVYASPLVLIVVLVAMRVGRVGGYIGAVASALTYNYWFVGLLHAGFVYPMAPELTAYAAMFIGAHIIGGRADAPPHQEGSGRYAGSLPFVRDKDDSTKRDFWAVNANGIWSDDCTVGHEYGRIYLARCTHYGAPALAWIVRDMIRAGRYTGVEAGFSGALANALPRRIASVSYDDALDADMQGSVVGADR